MVEFQEEEEPLWQVWLKRILVTALIAFVLEYLGQQPLPSDSGAKEEPPPAAEARQTAPPRKLQGQGNVEKKGETNEPSAATDIAPGTVVEIESEDQYQEILLKTDSVVVKFSAEWCRPCKEAEPDYESAAAKHREATFCVVDVDAFDEIATEYNVTMMPTFLVLYKGQLQKTLTGIDRLQERIADALDSEPEPEIINDEDIYDAVDNEDKEAKEEEEEPNNPTSAEVQESNNDEAAPKPIQFRNRYNHHPGMEGFHRWYDIETSLFRQYSVGRTDGVDVIPPYVKKSRNGQVRVSLRVENQFTDRSTNQKINVYWIDYMGHEKLKGTISRGETWYQTTYPEHPWVFRTSDTDEVLLHYIPERIIPHLDEAPTIEEHDPMVGVQRFAIKRPTDQALRDNHICSIEDKVMPHPASHHFHNPNQAHTWTLLHMQRMEYFTYNPSATLLCKYLTNICMHPDKANYRKIRIANPNFTSGIWQTAARGLLLGAGFVEQHAFAELGTAAPLSSGLVQDVSLVLYRLEQCCQALGQSSSADTQQQQPEGADGFGRGGFGRAGQMNVRR